MRELWDPWSWRNFQASQQPEYQNIAELEKTLAEINNKPPLVFSSEINQLKEHIREASLGKKFIIQGGDCAERFADCHPEAILNKVKILAQMATIVGFGIKKPIVNIGRIAGQYGKPRSNNIELINNKSFISYRGDNVNEVQASALARTPQPQRLLEGYHHASLTMNYLRAHTSDGFFDLRQPARWDLSFTENSPYIDQYRSLLIDIESFLKFYDSWYQEARLLREAPSSFYTSHEGLILGLESASTRWCERYHGYYNLGAHFLWIGDRTRSIHEAHAEYFRGIENPIGIKIGPNYSPDEICDLVKLLNPSNGFGKIMLIPRFGADKVADFLPELITSVQKSALKVCWSCDPMHGNTKISLNQIKTRNFSDILDELKKTISIHQKMGSIFSAVHFELTGEHVTECLGGGDEITAHDLSKSYLSNCDPRLNYRQSLEIAFLLSSLLQK